MGRHHQPSLPPLGLALALPAHHLCPLPPPPAPCAALASSDPVCARHALALASLLARDPQVGRPLARAGQREWGGGTFWHFAVFWGG